VSSSIGKRTQKLSFNYERGGWTLYSDNIRSSSAGEYAVGLKRGWGNLKLGGDLRVIGRDRLINNSGITLRYAVPWLDARLEARPLLKLGKVVFKPSAHVFGTEVGLRSSYSRAHYSLPSYSENLITYEVAPYLEGKGDISYRLGVGYSGKEYPLTPIKSYISYVASGRVSGRIRTGFFVHRALASMDLGRYNYVGLGEGTVGTEERTKFEYLPEIFDLITLTLSVSRTINLYTGRLKPLSKAYRDILVGGKLDLGGFELYLRRRREDHVLIDGSKSSDTRTLLRYVLGAQNTLGNITLAAEISAIYTLYRFKPEDNSLYRYMEMEAHYSGRGDFYLRLRLWDRGRYVADSNLYYRLMREMDIYSVGWIPVIEVERVDVGLSYDFRPDGTGVGIAAKFQGGEVSALRRREGERRFWNLSLKYSLSF